MKSCPVAGGCQESSDWHDPINLVVVWPKNSSALIYQYLATDMLFHNAYVIRLSGDVQLPDQLELVKGVVMDRVSVFR